MNITTNAPVETTTMRLCRWIATGLNIVALLFALAFLSLCGWAWFEDGDKMSLGGFLVDYFAFIFTFPVTLLSAIFSALLVGMRRSRLAWISLSAYPLAYLILIVAHNM